MKQAAFYVKNTDKKHLYIFFNMDKTANQQLISAKEELTLYV